MVSDEHVCSPPSQGFKWLCPCGQMWKWNEHFKKWRKV